MTPIDYDAAAMFPANSWRLPNLVALAAVLAACPGSPGSGDGSTASSSSSTASTTADASTSTTAPATSADDTSTRGDDPTTGGTDTEGACESPRLLARWVVPDLVDSTVCAGVGMDDSGDVLFLGGSNDSDQYHAQLVRLADGVVEWSVLHPASNEFVNALALAVRGDGVALMTGFADDGDPNYFQRLPWTAAYDELGNLMSESVVTGDACPRPPCFDGENHAAVVTATGELLIAGAQNVPDGSFNRMAVVRRYDPIAGELEATEFPTPEQDFDDITRAMALHADGSVVLLGQTHDLLSSNLWIARLSASLTFIDIGTLDAGEDDVPGGVVALSDGSIAFAARGDDQQYVARLSADLTPIWSRPSGNNGPMVLGDDESIFAVVGEDRIVEKLDVDGEPQWADDPCLDGEPARALALSPDGTQLIVGRRSGPDQVVELYDAGS